LTLASRAEPILFGMDHDEWNGSVCAICDLTARLRGDLLRATQAVHISERRLVAEWRATPDRSRRRALARELRGARARRAAIRTLLCDVAGTHGGAHAACA
jgi:hypothetical protein